MRRLSLVLVVACGNGGADVVPDAPSIDAPPNLCAPQPAIGQFIRRMGNPRLRAGTMFPDGLQDISMSDPDVRFDADANRYELYYMASHAMQFGPDGTQVIRHATSVDRVTWTVDDAPVLTASPDVAAWDHTHTETPTVAFNPAAPADRRYLLMYSGASRILPGHTFPEYGIGAAFSADGVSFTRVAADLSPHGEAGLVLTGAQTYPGSGGAIVADPELVVVDGVYHLFFSSFACTGPNCATITDFGIAHATSGDGITWTVVDAPIRSLLRASANRASGGQQPSVIYDATHCKWELWMTSDQLGENDNQPIEFNNMAGVWKAESTDGEQWSVNFAGRRDLEWNANTPAAGEALGLLTGADVTENAGGRLMLYMGFDDQDVPPGYLLPDRTQAGARPGVMVMNIATRDLP